jgi:hypothetical protein
MSAIRLFTDEDVYGVVAVALRKAGYDALSTPASGRRGESDESQLEWATNEGRVLVTFNVAHFSQLHAAWLSDGRHHAGIIVSGQRSVRDLLRRLLHLAASRDAGAMHDQLEFLSDW